MARVTVEDCIRHYPNRFEMVLLASRRARQVLRGMPKLMADENDKATVHSLREIGAGLLTWETLFHIDEQERRRQMAAAAAGNASQDEDN